MLMTLTEEISLWLEMLCASLSHASHAHVCMFPEITTWRWRQWFPFCFFLFFSGFYI